MDDKFRFLVACGVAAIASATAFVVVISSLPRRRRGLLTNFVRENFTAAFSTALIAIPSCALSGVLFGTLILMAFSAITGGIVDRQTRLSVACVTAIALYLASFIYLCQYL